MPHLTLHAVESQIAGHENALIRELTDAVTTVYGEHFRSSVVVRLDSVPDNRWGVGGQPGGADSAPEVRMGVRAVAFARDDWPTVAQRLVRAISDAVARALDQTLPPGTLVELVPEHDTRIAIDGVLLSAPQTS